MPQLSPKENKIVMTGGHAGSAAGSLVHEIKGLNLDWKIYWIGSKYAVEGKRIETLEYKILPKMGVDFVRLTTGRLQRRFTIYTIPSILKIPFGIIQSFKILKRINPKVVLSFGGYTSFPVVISAKILRIPVILHEQTAAIGRASLIESKFATVTAFSRESSLKYTKPAKYEITGNPIDRRFFDIKLKQKKDSPIIYVTGGSRGSQAINNTVLELLPQLLIKYQVIHQTGELDYDRFLKIKGNLPEKLSKNYSVFAIGEATKIIEIFSKSDLVISRSGANTTSELIAAKMPSILIPLPISYLNEQYENAKFAEEYGISTIILQKKLNPDLLMTKIEEMYSKKDEIIKNTKSKKSPDLGAAYKIINLLKEYMR